MRHRDDSVSGRVKFRIVKLAVVPFELLELGTSLDIPKLTVVVAGAEESFAVWRKRDRFHASASGTNFANLLTRFRVP